MAVEEGQNEGPVDGNDVFHRPDGDAGGANHSNGDREGSNRHLAWVPSHSNLETRGKSYRKGVEARRRLNMIKTRLFTFIVRKRVISRKTAIKGNKIGRKRKTKELIKLV